MRGALGGRSSAQARRASHHRSAVTHDTSGAVTAGVAVLCAAARDLHPRTWRRSRAPTLFYPAAKLEWHLQLGVGPASNRVAPAAINIAIVRPAGRIALTTGRSSVMFRTFGGRGIDRRALDGSVAGRCAIDRVHHRPRTASIRRIELPLDARSLAAIVSTRTEKKCYSADDQHAGQTGKAMPRAGGRKGCRLDIMRREHCFSSHCGLSRHTPK